MTLFILNVTCVSSVELKIDTELKQVTSVGLLCMGERASTV